MNSTVTVTPAPPSHYKIEMDPDNDNGGNMVQLVAGDHSSVQFTPDHNKRLQLADSEAGRAVAITCAWPVAEYEGI